MESFTLKIAGMSCGHCVRAVTGALEQMPGVSIGEVAVGRASGGYDPTRTSPGDLVKAIEAAGFEATPATES